MSESKICWDCKEPVIDYVMELRQVSGGGHGDMFPQVYAGDFAEKPVHANRRECLEAKKRRLEREVRAKEPFYDVAKEWSE